MAHNELHSRQKEILDALVRIYVRTAKPVSSEDLKNQDGVLWSSATIRNDFKVLDALGYIVQPHISAGRIPTDKAYRFYINERENPNEEHEYSQRTHKSLHGLSEKRGLSDEEFLRSAAAVLSELSHGFTTAGLIDDRLFFKYGFSDVLQEPEFFDQEVVQSFAECIDELERGAEGLFRKISVGRPEAFIGDENPIKEAREYGMVVYAYEKDYHTGKKKQIVSILGPKRMDYERNLSLMNEFDKIVKNFCVE
ncbi:MAG: hypothetical protein AAB362_03375 [Patescibacteria group bacterium]